jgi:hypothetical protein
MFGKTVDSRIRRIQETADLLYRNSSKNRVSLIDALVMISRLDESESEHHLETIGIKAAIYKRLWLIEKDFVFLSRAVLLYKRGFELYNDYWCGENYALCLDYERHYRMSTEDDDTKTSDLIELKFTAYKTRVEIIKMLEKIINDNPYRKSMFATLSNCYLAIEDKELCKKYGDKFLSFDLDSNEIKTYNSNRSDVIKFSI